MSNIKRNIDEEFKTNFCNYGAQSFIWKPEASPQKVLEWIKAIQGQAKVIVELTDIENILKSNLNVESKLREYLNDKQVYSNYGRSFVLPDDAEIVSNYIGIFIRTIIVDVKSKIKKLYDSKLPG